MRGAATGPPRERSRPSSPGSRPACVLGLADLVPRELDGVACVGLGPLCAVLRVLEVLGCLELVDPPSNVPAVRVPVVLDLLPMSFAGIGGRSRLGAQLSGSLVGVLAGLVDLGLQLGLALPGGGSDAAAGGVDLL